jgi:hypothetical protein
MADKSFSVAVIDNAEATNQRTLGLALTAPSGGATIQGVTKTAELTITEDETLFVLSSSTYSVNEGDGTVTITVSRLGNPAAAVSVILEDLPGGTATHKSDYDANYGHGVFTRLLWSAGDTADKSFAVDIIDDTQQEGAETVNLRLFYDATPGVAALGTPNTAVLTIGDND